MSQKLVLHKFKAAATVKMEPFETISCSFGFLSFTFSFFIPHITYLTITDKIALLMTQKKTFRVVNFTHSFWYSIISGQKIFRFRK